MEGVLAYGFMQRALAAGVVVALLCSVLSFFVVLKRLSFVGVGISHSALGGVALGVLLGWNPFVVGAVFAVGVAWAIGMVARQGELTEDTAIGILFASGMALGVVLMGLARGHHHELLGYLFGDILSVGPGELAAVAVTAAVLLVLTGLFFKELLFTAFDEEAAAASGLPVRALSAFLLTALAVTVVISIRVVGVIMVEALLVIPAATAYQLARNHRTMLAISVAVGILSALGGLWLAYRYELASGATIVLSATACFAVALAFSPRRRRTAAGRHPGAAAVSGEAARR